MELLALPDGRRGEKTQGSLTWITAVTLICLQALLQVVLGDVRLCRKWLVVVHMWGVLSSCCVRNSHVCGFLQCQALLNDNRVTGYDKRGKFSEFLEKET